jgi:hypothetical protein
MTNKTTDRAAYQRAYYEQNRERLTYQKKKRYQSDPAYRNAILDAKEKARSAKAEALRRKKEGEVTTYPMLITLGDGRRVLVEMLTLRSTSAVVGISAVTLRKWLDDGILPPQRFKNPKGSYLFTQDQVRVINRVYRRFYTPGARWRIEPAFVKALWEELALLNNGVDMV